MDDLLAVMLHKKRNAGGLDESRQCLANAFAVSTCSNQQQRAFAVSIMLVASRSASSVAWG